MAKFIEPPRELALYDSYGNEQVRYPVSSVGYSSYGVSTLTAEIGKPLLPTWATTNRANFSVPFKESTAVTKQYSTNPEHNAALQIIEKSVKELEQLKLSHSHNLEELQTKQAVEMQFKERRLKMRLLEAAQLGIDADVLEEHFEYESGILSEWLEEVLGLSSLTADNTVE